MGIFEKEIFKALGYLFISAIVFYVWNTARENAVKSNYKTVLWKGFLWCASFALFASLILGKPTCEEVSDPVYGGCDRYADDGFEPTTNQRAADFVYFITLFYIPVILGAYKGKKEKIGLNLNDSVKTNYND